MTEKTNLESEVNAAFGKVLVFCPEPGKPTYKALKQSAEVVYGDRITVGFNLVDELVSNRYELVIDASTLGKKTTEEGFVSRRMATLNLPSKPEVACVYNPLTVIADIGKLAAQFYEGIK